jgi:Lipocalin-like domain
MKKNIILTVLLIVGTLFTSCSNDDDNSNQETSIIGTWLEISVTGEFIRNDTSEGVESEEVIDENNFSSITFNDDGTFLIFYSNDYNGEIETDTLHGTYIIEDNIISFFYGGDQQDSEIDIFSLIDNQLIITLTEEYMSNGDEIVYKEVRTFTRL